MELIKVLIADDHTLFREGLWQLLEREDDIDCVALAEDGEETVRLAQELQPDVATIDILMPKMDGIEATRQIKKVFPDIAIIMVSAQQNDYYILASIEAGASGYFVKTVSSRDVVSAIRMVRTGKSIFDSEAMRRTFHSLVIGSKESKTLGSDELHARELEVLKLAGRSMSNKHIASELGISDHTVATHFLNIFRKLGVESRIGAVLYGLKKGWLSIDELGYDELGHK